MRPDFRASANPPKPCTCHASSHADRIAAGLEEIGELFEGVPPRRKQNGLRPLALTMGWPVTMGVFQSDTVGFVERGNRLHALLPRLERPTVLVLDNASVHRAKIVREKQAEWKLRGLRLLFLPPYCLHLNKIETLWRHIKYRWLEPEAYRDFKTLCQSVTDILAQVGTKYCITYA